MRHLFCESLCSRSVPNGSGYRLKNALGSGLGLARCPGLVDLQLLGYVSQDAELQRGQGSLQVRCAHVALGQPVDQRLGNFALLLSGSTAAKEQSLQLLTQLRGHLG